MPFCSQNATELTGYINLKLAAFGQPTSERTSDRYFLDLARPLLRNYYQKDQHAGGAATWYRSTRSGGLESMSNAGSPAPAGSLPE